MPDKKPTPLQIANAYWCNQHTGELIDRFAWVEDMLLEAVQGLTEDAYVLTLLLAQSAPNERCEALVAAGPLEDYINKVVAERRNDLAARIVGSETLKVLLPQVWGSVKELEPLASSYAGELTSEPAADTGLHVFNAKQLAGFWAATCVPSFVEEYELSFNGVLEALGREAERSVMENDLLISAPDSGAEEYLRVHIFSRYRH